MRLRLRLIKTARNPVFSKIGPVQGRMFTPAAQFRRSALTESYCRRSYEAHAGRSSGFRIILLAAPSHPCDFAPGQWTLRRSSPITAASPPPISTGFPGHRPTPANESFSRFAPYLFSYLNLKYSTFLPHFQAALKKNIIRLTPGRTHLRPGPAAAGCGGCRFTPRTRCRRCSRRRTMRRNAPAVSSARSSPPREPPCC